MRRNSNRLTGYDYSQNGAYFITICSNDHQNHFGEVNNDDVKLNSIGNIVDDWWYKIPEHFKAVELDEFKIMPNHIHGIILLMGDNCRGEVTSPKLKRPTLGKIVAYFKYKSTVEINLLNNTSGKKFWQRNYYEHIIRNEKALNKIREYIRYNHIKWDMDRENLLKNIK